MAPTKQLARQYRFYLNTGSVEVPSWVEIKSVNQWTPNPTKQDADTTTFDDQGVETHLPASRGYSYTLGGQVLQDGATGERDPGQAAVLAWSQLIGPEGLKQFRIMDPGSAGTGYQFLASANVTLGGGGNNDASAWNIEVRVSGPVEPVTVETPNAPTAVTGTAGDEHALIEWTDPTQGDPFDEFEVVIYDEDDSNAVVATIRTNSQPVYVPGLTNTNDYHARVRAKNAFGYGPQSDASSTFTPASA